MFSWHEARLYTVLMLQAMRHHFKLQCTHGTQQERSAIMRTEDLDCTFFTELHQPRA